MNKIIILLLSSLALIACSNVNTTTKVGEFFYDKEDSLYEEMYRYDEYVSAPTEETLRIFDCGNIEYINKSGHFVTHYSVHDDYLVFEHAYKKQADDNFNFYNDLICLKKTEDTLKQVDKYSYSNSGFLLANRLFRYSKSYNLTAKYAFEIEDNNTFSVSLSLTNDKGIRDFSSFEKQYKLEKYSSNNQGFSLLNNDANVVCYYGFESQQFEKVITDFIKVAKLKNCIDFSYSFYNIPNQLFNLKHYDLNQSDIYSGCKIDKLDSYIHVGPELIQDYSRFLDIIEKEDELDDSSKAKLLETYNESHFIENNVICVSLVSNSSLNFPLTTFYKDNQFYINYLPYYPTVNNKNKQLKLIENWFPIYYFSTLISVPKSLKIDNIIVIDGSTTYPPQE